MLRFEKECVRSLYAKNTQNKYHNIAVVMAGAVFSFCALFMILSVLFIILFWQDLPVVIGHKRTQKYDC